MLSADVSGKRKKRKTKIGAASHRSSNMLQCQSFTWRAYPTVMGPSAGAIVAATMEKLAVKRLCDEQYIPEALQIARTYGNLFNVNMSVNEAGLVDRDGEPTNIIRQKEFIGIYRGTYQRRHKGTERLRRRADCL
jgi:hypothetical protein